MPARSGRNSTSSTAPAEILPASGKTLAEVRPLLGSAWIIEGEDPKTYEQLLAEVGHAIGPRDILDWLLINDVVALTWEIQRARRLSAQLLSSSRGRALATLLWPQLPKPDLSFGPSPASELAEKWSLGDAAAVRKVEALLVQASLTLADVDAQAINHHAKDFDLLDARVERCEDRRDKLLRQIERRREGAAKHILDASEEVVEAEYVACPPNGIATKG